MDLDAVTIQRGRDHGGVPAARASPRGRLIDARQAPPGFGLPRIARRSWAQMVNGTCRGQYLWRNVGEVLDQVVLIQEAGVKLTPEERRRLEGRQQQVDVVTHALDAEARERLCKRSHSIGAVHGVRYG